MLFRQLLLYTYITIISDIHYLKTDTIIGKKCAKKCIYILVKPIFIANFAMKIYKTNLLVIFNITSPMNLLFIGGLGATEIFLIVLALLLLFGGKKLPELMRGAGRGIREFKDAVNTATSDDKKEEKKENNE